LRVADDGRDRADVGGGDQRDQVKHRLAARYRCRAPAA
jgi:hypothetical protein